MLTILICKSSFLVHSFLSFSGRSDVVSLEHQNISASDPYKGVGLADVIIFIFLNVKELAHVLCNRGEKNKTKRMACYGV